MMKAGLWTLPFKPTEQWVVPHYRFNYVLDTTNLPRMSPNDVHAWVVELDKSGGANGFLLVSEQRDEIITEREFPLDFFVRTVSHPVNNFIWHSRRHTFDSESVLPAKVSTIEIRFQESGTGGNRPWHETGMKFEEIDLGATLRITLDPRSDLIRLSAERAIKSIKRVDTQPAAEIRRGKMNNP